MRLRIPEAWAYLDIIGNLSDADGFRILFTDQGKTRQIPTHISPIRFALIIFPVRIFCRRMSLPIRVCGQTVGPWLNSQGHRGSAPRSPVASATTARARSVKGRTHRPGPRSTECSVLVTNANSFFFCSRLGGYSKFMRRFVALWPAIRNIAA